MDQSKLTDTECTLYGTKACALLNMQDCDKCPLKGRVADPAIIDDLRLFCDLQPEGTVASLFESEICTLCKNEPKGKPACFAVFDMAHTEPKKLAKRKWLSGQETGFMVPLQFACCAKCRRRILFLSYLPLIASIVLLLITLPFVMIERFAQALRAAAGWLPIAIVFFAFVGGYGVGKLLAALYKRRIETDMYVDVRLHPFTVNMVEKGWRWLFNERVAHLAFTKKRIDRGLGTAPSAVYDLPDREESSEEKNSD